MGSGPRVPIRNPHAAHLLEREGSAALPWGSPGELTGLQTCIQNMVNKKLKLVNIVQVMLIRRILPCQQRAFNLWEFDAAQHQTLSELFDTTHKDAWKVLFKGAEDRGFSAKRQASA